MDCAGLGALVEVRNQADQRGGRLILRGVGRSVARVAVLLRLTGLNPRLTIEP
ncbi:hypothetical protein GCM10010430_78330 [Kitasatospora cystarginea]|uniref:STAS domain-containing protein n=2 Tax=Streptomycetaceae TaxID=2062 RepID=A0ABP5S019_9ACTN